MLRIRVPATTANLGPGFDTLGMALSLYMVLEVYEDGSSVTGAVRSEERLNLGSRDSLAVSVMHQVLKEQGYNAGNLVARVRNEIPIGRGLGSSAAAIIAGLAGARLLTGQGIEPQELINRATLIEGHPDNVVPAVVGGITVCLNEGEQVYFRRIEPPEGLEYALAVPDFELSTVKSRLVRPGDYVSEDVVFNLQRACFLVASLATGQLDNLGIAMSDRIHQPYRSHMIPGFDSVIEKAFAAGALGVALSGSGPSMLAITNGNSENVAKVMVDTFCEAGIKAQAYWGKPDLMGLVIEKE